MIMRYQLLKQLQYKEVTEGTSTISIPFELEVAEASGTNVVVTYSTTNGTATAGSDFVEPVSTPTPTNTVTITGDGTTRKGNIEITIMDDNTDEPVEDFTVTITGVTGGTAVLSRTTAELTTTVEITDNDNAVSITDAATAKEVTEGTTTISIPIELEVAEASDASDVVVTFSTSDGTATAGSDFVAPGSTPTATNTATITSDGTNRTGNIVVTITDDDVEEQVEDFTVTITGVSGGTAVLSRTTAELSTTVNINDADGVVSFSTATQTIDENHADAKIVIPVTLAPADTTGDVVVSYEVVAGTATAGTDYTLPDPTTVTFVSADGDTTKDIEIDITEDSDIEGNETFTVRLLSSPTASISDTAGEIVVTITDDESGAFIPGASAGISVAEDVTGGKVTIPFELSAVPDSVVTLTLSTTDGTAEVGEDFVTLSTNTVTIDPGTNNDNKTASIEIDITDDQIDEDDETFTVTIDSAEDASGTSISTTTATASIVVTIIEDDNAVKITDATTAKTVTEGTTTVSIPIELEVAEATGDDVVVTFEITDGTATAGTDFTLPNPLTETITGDDTTKTGNFNITIADDDLDEPIESFTVTITGVTGGSAVLSSTASELTTTVEITDNDNGVSISDAATAKTVTEGTTTVTIPFEIETPIDEVVTVTFSTTDGTAEVGSDFVALGSNNTETLAANAKSGTFEITITDDELDEPEESFTVNIDSAAGTTTTSIPVSTASGSTEVKIADNDNGVSITNASDGISCGGRCRNSFHPI